MGSPIIDGETIIALVANPGGNNNYHIYFGMGNNKDEAVDALYQYISKGLENRQGHPVALWDVLVCVVENIKRDKPEVAAEIRRQNIEHIKKRNQ